MWILIGQRGKTAPEWFEVLGDAEPKHGETVQTKTDTRVVYDADVEVAGVDTEVALVVLAEDLQDQGGDGQ